MKYYLGADPGRKGAIALLPDDKFSPPTIISFLDQEPWEDQVIDILQEWGGKLRACGVELVNSAPIQGADQAAKLASTSGVLRGILKMTALACEIPYYRVSPQKWQGEIGLSIPKEGLYDDQTPEERKKIRAKNKYNLKKGVYIWAKQKFPKAELKSFKEGGSDQADALAIAYWISLQK